MALSTRFNNAAGAAKLRLLGFIAAGALCFWAGGKVQSDPELSRRWQQVKDSVADLGHDIAAGIGGIWDAATGQAPPAPPPTCIHLGPGLDETRARTILSARFPGLDIEITTDQDGGLQACWADTRPAQSRLAARRPGF